MAHPPPTTAPSAPLSGLSEEHLEQIVASYLKKKGYRQAEAVFKHEAGKSRLQHSANEPSNHTDAAASASNVVQFFNASEYTPDRYRESYAKLRDWVHASLDLYKGELLAVLYPIMIHCYLDLVSKGYAEEARAFIEEHRAEHEDLHHSEIQRISGVATLEHMHENEAVQLFRKNKYNISLSAYSFELLITFLQEHKFMLLLGIVNQHLHIKVVSGQPGGYDVADSGNGVAASGHEIDSRVSSKTVHWGLLPPSTTATLAALDASASEKEKKEGADGEKENEKEKEGEGEKEADGATATKGKGKSKAKGKAKPKGKDAKEAEKKAEPEEGAVLEKSMIPLPRVNEQLETLKLEDLKQRIALAPSSLPSIICYTLLNGNNSSNCLAVSEDCALVASGFSDSTVKIWNMRKRDRKGFPPVAITTGTPPPPGAAAAPPPPPPTAAAGSASPATPSLSASMNKPPPPPGAAAAAASPIKTEDPSRPPPPPGAGASAASPASSTPSTTTGASASANPPDTGSDYLHFIGHSGPVYAASFSPDGQHLLTASEDKTVRLWSLATQTCLVAYRGHNYPVWDVQFSPLGYYFATASHDRTARLWSTEHVTPLRIFAGHLSDVDCVIFHPNCNYVATGSADRTARLWEVQSGECVRLFAGHPGAVSALAISPDGRLLATAAGDGIGLGGGPVITLWDIASSRRIRTLSGHVRSITSLDFSREGALLASGGLDNTVRIWDVSAARRSSAAAAAAALEDAQHGATNGVGAAAAAASAARSVVGTTAGGGRAKRPREEASPELLNTFPTKKTPIYQVKFTRRNLLIAAGVYRSSEGK